MDHGNSDERGHSGSRSCIATAVIAGIILFVAGFAVTLASLPEDGTATSLDDDTGSTYASETSSASAGGTLLLVGLLLSMVGVVLATVIPAALFIRRTHRNA